jgi:hypothetical protein
MKALPLALSCLAMACGNGDDSNVAPVPARPDASVDATAVAAEPEDAGDAGPDQPHPEASATSPDPSTLRDLAALCLPGGTDMWGLCPTYLCCLDNSACRWDRCSIAPPGHVRINMLSSIAADAGPSGASVSTITSPPFHGLCFVQPDAGAPSWCETVTPVGDVVLATNESDAQPPVPESSQDLTVLVTVSAALGGSPAYQYEVCYLPGTLDRDTDPGSTCADMGGYCCYPPHSMGPLDTQGFLGVPPGDYYFAFHSMPDVSTAGPVPFGTWGPNGVVTDVP